MNKSQFKHFWAKNFPETPPINHLFKHNLTERWLRIHSLPEDKRYATTAEEWVILKVRQNTVFEDLIPRKSKIYLVLQLFSDKLAKLKPNIGQNEYFKKLKFVDFEDLDYFDITQLWVDENLILHTFFAEINLEEPYFDDILTAIANDEIRAFFVPENGECLVAPYDGGVDLVFKDIEIRGFYQKKYENWLPKT
jgi:hypothetical protein